MWQKLVLRSTCDWSRGWKTMHIRWESLHDIPWRRLLWRSSFVQIGLLWRCNVGWGGGVRSPVMYVAFLQLSTDSIHFLLVCLNLPPKHVPFIPPMSFCSLLQILCSVLDAIVHLLFHAYHLNLLKFLLYLVSHKAVCYFFLQNVSSSLQYLGTPLAGLSLLCA